MRSLAATRPGTGKAKGRHLPMLIPWRAGTERSVPTAVVTHGKAWADSLFESWLEGRASPTRKGADLRTSHTGMGIGG